MYSGGTKKGEFNRSAELFAEICKNQDPYYALAFLMDSGYEREDLLEIMKIMEPKKTTA